MSRSVEERGGPALPGPEQHVAVPLIITGMHRSGTSLVASVLQRAGVAIGRDLLPPNEGNRRGYFEDPAFVGLHGDALDKRGSGREGLAEVPDEEPAGFDADERARAMELIDSRRGDPVFGFKDPRATLFLSSWARLLPEARFVLIYREPVAVVASLMKRGSASERKVIIDPLVGLDLWKVYNQVLLGFSVANRERCYLCDVRAVTEDVESFLGGVSRKLGVALRDEGARELVHSEELMQVPMVPPVSDVVEAIDPETPEIYRRLERGADLTMVSPPSSLPAGAAELLVALASFIRAEPEHEVHRSRLCGLLLTLVAPQVASRRSDLISGLKAVEARCADLQALLQEHEAYVAKLEDHAGDLEGLKNQHEGYIAELAAHIRDLEGLRDEHESYIGRLQDRIADLEADLSERSLDET